MDLLIVNATIILFFAIFFSFIAFMRWLRYKETLTLAERGLLREKSQSAGPNRQTRYGVVLTAVGGALTCGLATIGLDPFTPLIGPWLLGGLLPLSVGLSLLYLGRTADQRNEQLRAEELDEIPFHKREL